MNDRQKRILYGLICMVEQQLGGIGNDELWGGGWSTHENALIVLAECGMAELTAGCAKGRWTEAGNLFRHRREGREKAEAVQELCSSSLNGQEQKILNALVMLVEQQMGETGTDELWSRGLSAYERALIVLAEFELVELTFGCIAGRWTATGKQLCCKLHEQS